MALRVRLKPLLVLELMFCMLCLYVVRIDCRRLRLQSRAVSTQLADRSIAYDADT